MSTILSITSSSDPAVKSPLTSMHWEKMSAESAALMRHQFAKEIIRITPKSHFAKEEDQKLVGIKFPTILVHPDEILKMLRSQEHLYDVNNICLYGGKTRNIIRGVQERVSGTDFDFLIFSKTVGDEDTKELFSRWIFHKLCEDRDFRYIFLFDFLLPKTTCEKEIKAFFIDHTSSLGVYTLPEILIEIKKWPWEKLEKLIRILKLEDLFFPFLMNEYLSKINPVPNKDKVPIGFILSVEGADFKVIKPCRYTQSSSAYDGCLIKIDEEVYGYLIDESPCSLEEFPKKNKEFLDQIYDPVMHVDNRIFLLGKYMTKGAKVRRFHDNCVMASKQFKLRYQKAPALKTLVSRISHIFSVHFSEWGKLSYLLNMIFVQLEAEQLEGEFVDQIKAMAQAFLLKKPEHPIGKLFAQLLLEQEHLIRELSYFVVGGLALFKTQIEADSLRLYLETDRETCYLYAKFSADLVLKFIRAVDVLPSGILPSLINEFAFPLPLTETREFVISLYRNIFAEDLEAIGKLERDLFLSEVQKELSKIFSKSSIPEFLQDTVDILQKKKEINIEFLNRWCERLRKDWPSGLNTFKLLYTFIHHFLTSKSEKSMIFCKQFLLLMDLAEKQKSLPLVAKQFFALLLVDPTILPEMTENSTPQHIWKHPKEAEEILHKLIQNAIAVALKRTRDDEDPDLKLRLFRIMLSIKDLKEPVVVVTDLLKFLKVTKLPSEKLLPCCKDLFLGPYLTCIPADFYPFVFALLDHLKLTLPPGEFAHFFNLCCKSFDKTVSTPLIKQRLLQEMVESFFTHDLKSFLHNVENYLTLTKIGTSAPCKLRDFSSQEHLKLISDFLSLMLEFEPDFLKEFFSSKNRVITPEIHYQYCLSLLRQSLAHHKLEEAFYQLQESARLTEIHSKDFLDLTEQLLEKSLQHDPVHKFIRPIFDRFIRLWHDKGKERSLDKVYQFLHENCPITQYMILDEIFLLLTKREEDDYLNHLKFYEKKKWAVLPSSTFIENLLNFFSDKEISTKNAKSFLTLFENILKRGIKHPVLETLYIDTYKIALKEMVLGKTPEETLQILDSISRNTPIVKYKLHSLIHHFFLNFLTGDSRKQFLHRLLLNLDTELLLMLYPACTPAEKDYMIENANRDILKTLLMNSDLKDIDLCKRVVKKINTEKQEKDAPLVGLLFTRYFLPNVIAREELLGPLLEALEYIKWFKLADKRKTTKNEFNSYLKDSWKLVDYLLEQRFHFDLFYNYLFSFAYNSNPADYLHAEFVLERYLPFLTSKQLRKALLALLKKQPGTDSLLTIKTVLKILMQKRVKEHENVIEFYILGINRTLSIKNDENYANAFFLTHSILSIISERSSILSPNEEESLYRIIVQLQKDSFALDKYKEVINIHHFYLKHLPNYQKDFFMEFATEIEKYLIKIKKSEDKLKFINIFTGVLSSEEHVEFFWHKTLRNILTSKYSLWQSIVELLNQTDPIIIKDQYSLERLHLEKEIIISSLEHKNKKTVTFAIKRWLNHILPYLDAKNDGEFDILPLPLHEYLFSWIFTQPTSKLSETIETYKSEVFTLLNLILEKTFKTTTSTSITIMPYQKIVSRFIQQLLIYPFIFLALKQFGRKQITSPDQFVTSLHKLLPYFKDPLAAASARMALHLIKDDYELDHAASKERRLVVFNVALELFERASEILSERVISSRGVCYGNPQVLCGSWFPTEYLAKFVEVGIAGELTSKYTKIISKNLTKFFPNGPENEIEDAGIDIPVGVRKEDLFVVRFEPELKEKKEKAKTTKGDAL